MGKSKKEVRNGEPWNKGWHDAETSNSSHLLIASTSEIALCTNDQNPIGSCGMERKNEMILDRSQFCLERRPVCTLIGCFVMRLALGQKECLHDILS